MSMQQSGKSPGAESGCKCGETRGSGMENTNSGGGGRDRRYSMPGDRTADDQAVGGGMPRPDTTTGTFGSTFGTAGAGGSGDQAASGGGAMPGGGLGDAQTASSGGGMPGGGMGGGDQSGRGDSMPGGGEWAPAPAATMTRAPEQPRSRTCGTMEVHRRLLSAGSRLRARPG